MATINDLVAKYIEIRDRKDALRRRYKEKNAVYDNALKKLEGVLLKNLDHSDAKSVRTDSGTCYVAKRTSATVADRDVFLEFVADNDAWDMVESRCSKLAIKQYLDAEGHLPPGVNYRVERVLNVNRS